MVVHDVLLNRHFKIVCWAVANKSKSVFSTLNMLTSFRVKSYSYPHVTKRSKYILTKSSKNFFNCCLPSLLGF